MARKIDAAAEPVFQMFEAAAVEGLRCPTNPDIAARLVSHNIRVAASTVPAIVRQLTRAGRVKVKLYGGLWRQVVICSGPNAGKATQARPGSKPFIVIDSAERARRDAGSLTHRLGHSPYKTKTRPDSSS